MIRAFFHLLVPYSDDDKTIAVAFVFYRGARVRAKDKIIPTPADVAEARRCGGRRPRPCLEDDRSWDRQDASSQDRSCHRRLLGVDDDGKMSIAPATGKAATFPLDKVIAGWIEGVH